MSRTNHVTPQFARSYRYLRFIIMYANGNLLPYTVRGHYPLYPPRTNFFFILIRTLTPFVHSSPPYRELPPQKDYQHDQLGRSRTLLLLSTVLYCASNEGSIFFLFGFSPPAVTIVASLATLISTLTTLLGIIIT